MQWVKHQNRIGFEMEHPAGWTVETLPGPTVIVRTPDRQGMAIFQVLGRVGETTGKQIIESGFYSAAIFLPQTKLESVEEGPERTAVGMLNYVTPNGLPGFATVFYVANDGIATLRISVAPKAMMQEMYPHFMRILESFNPWSPPAAAPVAPAPAPIAAPPPPSPASPTGGPNLAAAMMMGASTLSARPGSTPPPIPFATSKSPPPVRPTGGPNLAAAIMMGAPTPSAPLGSAPPPIPFVTSKSPPPLPINLPLTYVTYTDSQAHSFSLEVPQGWHVTAGLAHPQAGDRRCWVEAVSPDGIYILCDPGFPQNFCHFRGHGNGSLIPLAAGGLFVNLQPSAEQINDYYLKQNLSRKIANLKPVARRPRPDSVEQLKIYFQKHGAKMARKFQITSDERTFIFDQHGQPRIASLLATAAFNGEYLMGMWAFWDANLFLYVASPQQAARAEEVRWHMKETFQILPPFWKIYQQDEAAIAAASQAANNAQWSWFNNQQAAHNAQVAAGDAQVQGYWETQRSNDRMLRGWEHNQAINDRLMQNYSDATMDRQRLFDDAAGMSYEVPADSNYYWRNPQTGQITGTETDQPPDYNNNYTQLRKPQP